MLKVCQSILQEGLDHGADIADRLDHTLAWNSYLDRPLVLYLNLNLILTLGTKHATRNKEQTAPGPNACDRRRQRAWEKTGLLMECREGHQLLIRKELET